MGHRYDRGERAPAEGSASQRAERGSGARAAASDLSESQAQAAGGNRLVDVSAVAK